MVLPGIVDVAPWRDCASAVEGVLEFLHGHLGWDVWSVTRVEGEHQIVLRAWPPDVVRPGTSLDWEGSYCRQMVTGAAPRVATVTAAVPEYARAGEWLHEDVAAYLGAPLVTAGGELFGTLCAVSFRARPRSAARDLPLVELLARLLSSLIAADGRPPGELAEELLADRPAG